ncbi:1,3-beta-glucanosyltransferase GAS5 [Zancudomyces culisetae]|uniref:1,3-beta-glucanosyltransferase n=1 Tax=Zancudomyces culisetae TaxID=1213189 RepID=A0A1R1PC26_ZANCU|nr:1,3-beta-glucanosyltransferase GAS5 [Zancudomyces culisetae]|eukprot:OMH78504.1 1,3-beta-glucanosyltransferase GAS5 [Zancudomyces culisetae]
MQYTTNVLIGVVLCLSTAMALPKLEIRGSKFYNTETNQQFFFKGVTYQPRTGSFAQGYDPLADKQACDRDVPVLKELGVNVIRVYETNFYLNHDYCMDMLDKNGMYVLLDIPTSYKSIDRHNPSWNTELEQFFELKIQAFAHYNNVAGFIIGNEVVNSPDTIRSAKAVKQGLRSVKSYMKAQNINIPVGYADVDHDEIAQYMTDYFNCSDDPNERLDFYGLNTYRWCGDADFKTSGYDTLTNKFLSYSIPVLFTEYGCNTYLPRSFNEVSALYSKDMNSVFSGGLVYEFTQEDNKYGLVELVGDGAGLNILDDFYNLKRIYGTVVDTGPAVSQKGNRTNELNRVRSKCPTPNDFWTVD